MEKTDNDTTEKPMKGAWNTMKGYPQKIKFELNKSVAVTFDAKFEGPREMDNTDGNGVFYIFDCLNGDGEKSSFLTSAWTLLNSLKSHEPLAGKNLIITQKLNQGKKYYYVQKPDTYNAPDVSGTEEPNDVDTDNAGLDKDNNM